MDVSLFSEMWWAFWWPSDYSSKLLAWTPLATFPLQGVPPACHFVWESETTTIMDEKWCRAPSDEAGKDRYSLYRPYPYLSIYPSVYIYCMNYVAWNVHVQHLQQLRIRFKKLTAKTVSWRYLGPPLSFVTLNHLGCFFLFPRVG